MVVELGLRHPRITWLEAIPGKRRAVGPWREWRKRWAEERLSVVRKAVSTVAGAIHAEGRGSSSRVQEAVGRVVQICWVAASIWNGSQAGQSCRISATCGADEWTGCGIVGTTGLVVDTRLEGSFRIVVVSGVRTGEHVRSRGNDPVTVVTREVQIQASQRIADVGSDRRRNERCIGIWIVVLTIEVPELAAGSSIAEEQPTSGGGWWCVRRVEGIEGDVRTKVTTEGVTRHVRHNPTVDQVTRGHTGCNLCRGQAGGQSTVVSEVRRRVAGANSDNQTGRVVQVAIGDLTVRCNQVVVDVQSQPWIVEPGVPGDHGGVGQGIGPLCRSR